MAGLVGQRLGQYEIVDRLGEGGMATVYRARQLNIKREVAIKVMAANLERDESFVRRFQREAQTLASLSHPHILKIFDYGQQDDMVYLVMELIPGGSLADRIKDGPLALPEAQRLLDEIAQALDYAHLEHIIHRDLKPQNVLLDQRGNALLTDFGIAKLLSEATALTQSGVAMGTPAYMAPEQWRGEEIDARTDTYALGVMLFEMLSGGLPFNQSTPFSMMYSHVNEPPPSLVRKNPNLPAGIDQVIDKAMAKDREQRYQSAADMSAAFTAAIKGGPPPAAVQPPSPPDRDGTVPELPIPTSPPPATKVPDDMSGPTMPPSAPPISPTRSPSPTQRAPRNSSRESIVASGPIQIVTPPPEPKRGISPTLIGAGAAIVIFAIVALLLLPKLTAPTTPATLAAGVAGASTATTISTTAAPQGTATGAASASTSGVVVAGAVTVSATATPVIMDNFTDSPVPPTDTSTTAPSDTPIPPSDTSVPPTATSTIADTETTEPTLTSTPVPPTQTPLVVANAVTAITPLTATSTNTAVPPTVAPTGTFTLSPVPPSNSPIPPTDTAVPTNTASPLPPTSTPLPTDTVTATFTLTPIPPTSTALPTDTLTLTYTASPLPPTSTALPTDTPVPTDTITVTASVTTVATVEATLAPTEPQAATQAATVNATVNATAPSGPTTAPGTPRMDAKGVAQVWVAAGCFQMGSDPAKVKGAGKDEQPQHQACITQGFWLDQNLVTNAEYADFVSAGGYTNKQYWSDDGWKWLQANSVTGPQDSKNFTDPQQPRVGVSWYEADAYARWRGGRLPTEAEWEYAARGPQSLIYPWGDTFDKANANVNTKGTTPVGQFAAGKNWVGAFDMSGNVWEWVNDWYSDTYYQQSDTNNPPGPTSGDSRVMRGGAWDYSELFARGASRSDLSPDSQGYDTGFRMVTSAP